MESDHGHNHNHNHNDDINSRLYEASINGNVDTLNQLIQQDGLVLTRITPTFFHENPLHIAALKGHTEYSKALLGKSIGLAKEKDAWGHTALHLASAKGNVDMVKALLEADCGACLMRSYEGKLPLHLAIMKRRVGVVKELVEKRPESARVLLDRGQTVAHLCVEHNNLKALRVIAEKLKDDQFLASVDEDGNTILHLAAAFKHSKIVKYIIQKEPQIVNTLNNNGFTALDMAEKSIPRDDEVANILIKAGIPRADPPPAPPSITKVDTTKPEPEKNRKFLGCIKRLFHHDDKWVQDMRGGLMVAATLTATMAFQAGLQPPGGVWGPQGPDSDIMAGPPGSAVAATEAFFTYNTLAFLSSMSVVLLLVSGSPLTASKLGIWVLMLPIWGTLTFMTLTYSESLMKVVNRPDPRKTMANNGKSTPNHFYSRDRKYRTLILVWLALLGGVVLYHSLFVIVWIARRILKLVWYCVMKMKGPYLKRGVSAVVCIF